jgi:hypothetical protein
VHTHPTIKSFYRLFSTAHQLTVVNLFRLYQNQTHTAEPNLTHRTTRYLKRRKIASVFPPLDTTVSLPRPQSPLDLVATISPAAPGLAPVECYPQPSPPSLNPAALTISTAGAFSPFPLPRSASRDPRRSLHRRTDARSSCRIVCTGKTRAARGHHTVGAPSPSCSRLHSRDQELKGVPAGRSHGWWSRGSLAGAVAIRGRGWWLQAAVDWWRQEEVVAIPGV